MDFITKDWFHHVADYLTLMDLWRLRLVSREMNRGLRANWKWWKTASAHEKEADIAQFSPKNGTEAERLFRYGWRLLLEQTPGKRSDGHCHKCKEYVPSSQCWDCSQKPFVFPCRKCGLLRIKTNRAHQMFLRRKKK